MTEIVCLQCMSDGKAHVAFLTEAGLACPRCDALGFMAWEKSEESAGPKEVVTIQ